MPMDRSRYPHNWEVISWQIRGIRAGWQCECEGECGHDHGGRCTAVHGHPHPVTGSPVVLTVAHLCHDDCSEIPDGKGKCGEASHCRAMCQRCHLSLDLAHHTARAAATRRRRQVEAGQMTLFNEVQDDSL